MRKVLPCLIFLLSIATRVSADTQETSPIKSIIPDSKTAIAVGCTILDSYFPDWTRQNKNLGCEAEKEGAGWIVYKKIIGPGGSPTVELSRADGRVLRIYMTE